MLSFEKFIRDEQQTDSDQQLNQICDRISGSKYSLKQICYHIMVVKLKEYFEKTRQVKKMTNLKNTFYVDK